MKHPTYTAVCAICRQNAGEVAIEGGIVYENSLWLVRHTASPAPLVGWTMFHTQRHVQGPAHFTDQEAQTLGPALRTVCEAIERLTGALRVYVMNFGESTPHMHAHLVPRYQDMPAGVPWSVADLYRAVGQKKEKPADQAKVLEFTARLRTELAKKGLPG
ncbi:MAG: diadenosine tetraphosphate hydrolase [Chloroflexi bacterium]|nr:diadenosine tetraphosphate hydrolase [Chloroflexota bacterium]